MTGLQRKIVYMNKHLTSIGNLLCRVVPKWHQERGKLRHFQSKQTAAKISRVQPSALHEFINNCKKSCCSNKSLNIASFYFIIQSVLTWRTSMAQSAPEVPKAKLSSVTKYTQASEWLRLRNCRTYISKNIRSVFICVQFDTNSV
jgi:hypothetical protein